MGERGGGERRRRVVAITGASAGVGRATARAFAAEGARVALIARGREGLEAAARDVNALGGEALVLPADVSSFDQVDGAADAIERAWGGIDVWVNDAMVTVFADSWDVLPAEHRRVMEVVYLGFVHGTLAALARMRPRDHGVIIQVGSALAYRSIPLQSAYCAAKHAMVGFTEALRCELIHGKSRVRLCVVNMPGLNTPQFTWGLVRMPREPQPVPPIYQPEIAARTIVAASHRPRRVINVGWPTLKAIFGQRVIPGLLDHYLARKGYDSQLTQKPHDPERPHNLWRPLPGDAGAHGPFSSRAHDRSLAAWLATHRLVGVGGALVLVAVGLSWTAFLRAWRPGAWLRRRWRSAVRRRGRGRVRGPIFST
jgi:NAD(P)-dependent dehydrogenase (short-subunit alcohol dehydrogenase family)